MTRSEAELWNIRAKAAEDAAVELEGLASDLEKVLRRYYFGTDCVEGEALHAALQSFFSSIGGSLAEAALDAERLGVNCRAAARMLAETDEENANEFVHGSHS